MIPMSWMPLLLLLVIGRVDLVSSQVAVGAGGIVTNTNTVTVNEATIDLSAGGGIIDNLAMVVETETETELSSNDNGSTNTNRRDDQKKKQKKKKTPLVLANAQIDWVVSKGGSFDRDKVVIRSIFDDDDSESDGDGDGDGENCLAKNNNVVLGMYAADDIAEGDLLMKIPIALSFTKGTCLVLFVCCMLQFLARGYLFCHELIGDWIGVSISQ